MSKELKIMIVGSVFQPSSPIDDRALFAGRADQIMAVANAIGQRGQHVVIYGERGVGKTSLANVILKIIDGIEENGRPLSVRLNCDESMDFKSLFRQIFSEITVSIPVATIGFEAEAKVSRESLRSLIADEDASSPNRLRHVFGQLRRRTVIVLDEFDRLKNMDAKRMLSDTIKNFSDYGLDLTFVLVGVADSIEPLIAEHQSIERALVQVQMPRMANNELEEIVNKGLLRLEMTIDPLVRQKIVELSQGLPHFTHLLSLNAAQAAIRRGGDDIQAGDLDVAITESIKKTQQTVKSAYDKAVYSPRGNLYKEVLYSCAMASNDEMGYFSAVDVRDSLRKITGKNYQIAAFARHLKEFCEEKRGPVLIVKGTARTFRYRFMDPIMEPFVLLRGISRADSEEGRK